MSEIKFNDFLLFVEAKNKSIVKSILEGPEQPGKPISESLSYMRDQELSNLEANKIFQELGDQEKETVVNLVNDIFEIKEKTVMENSKVAKFSRIASEMVDTYTRKNHDYGDSFGESIKKYGSVAGLVRMSDKWNRLNSLIMGEEAQVKEESIIDTLTDLACYAVMMRIELESQA